MSIIDWFIDLFRKNDDKLPRTPEAGRRPPDLDDGFNVMVSEYADRPIIRRTSQVIADEIESILTQLKSAEQIIADTREALKEREAELIAKCDEEAAAATAAYEAEIAKVERLRPKPAAPEADSGYATTAAGAALVATAQPA